MIIGQPVMMTPNNAIAKIPNASPCPALHNESSPYSTIPIAEVGSVKCSYPSVILCRVRVPVAWNLRAGSYVMMPDVGCMHRGITRIMRILVSDSAQKTLSLDNS